MSDALGPIDLEILRNQLEGVAEEMGDVLIRGAYSPNIAERRDCSTAIFDADGRLVAQAEHIPVHLGAMPDAVEAVRECDPEPGDVFVLNDPFAGGTHLPDVTMVSPITHEAPGASERSGGPCKRDGRIVAYAASRAHHADVGGMAPGSMPAGARDVHQEGLRIPPTRLVVAGELRDEVEDLLLANVRNPRQRRADLRAQRAANDRGAERIDELLDEHGEELLTAFDAVIEYSRERVEGEIDALPDGRYEARDVLEGDGITDTDIPIAVAVTIDGERLDVDFSGTAGQVAGNVNAPLSVAKSAVLFVVRCVTDPDVPPNQGCYDPVTVSAPAGSLLNPEPPAAVVGGNVETSQRVADVVFAAISEVAPERVPADGQGTMNNLVIGSPTFTYYETIGGGGGATAGADGMDAVQVGMTNTQNTPVEALEGTYPLTVEEYAIRRGSGGDGAQEGGDGLRRSIRLESEATVSLLTERRRYAPAGRAGGGDGTTGRNLIDGDPVPAKTTRELAAGTVVTVLTPGGGGYGQG
ncbi:hydantoinase B/oxoprolinase family protein [Halorhabdus amylolytica]|uniref:hydantoinase B/oxoprolinase family protein n=1 Tax=Halorhabdus amylolytica TaxID=2559573 RepID=UPI0010A9CB44|nr:hydantoinase B/oxoprolinase family protein [Halorhabdus amylolytica]